MNPGTKIKSLYILVGILLIINFGTLAFVWFAAGKLRSEFEVHPPNPENGSSFLANELGLTGAQLEKFDTLKKGHRLMVQNIMLKTKELKDELFECIKTGNDSRAREIARMLSANNEAMEMLTYEHFKEVRQICNDEQKVKFDKILAELVRGLEAQSHPPFGLPPRDDKRPPEDRPPHRD